MKTQLLKPNVDDKTVLDASAVIAYLNKETGMNVVAGYLGNACMSAVNASEVISDLLGRGATLELALKLFGNLEIEVFPHDFDQAVKVAEIKKKLPRKAAISRADCACFALAETLSLPVLTADQSWSTLNLKLKITQIR
jgi:ribonuclease VapC